jgi:hypothetical protein
MTEEKKNSLPAKIAAQPAYQALIIFVFSAFLTLIDTGTHLNGIGTTTKNSTWILMTTCILFYAVCSSVLSLFSRHPNRYWRDAILSYVGLLVISALTARMLSGLSMDEAGSFRWLFVVLSIGYLVFLSIVRLMRRIVEIAIRQDEKLRGE